MKFQRSEVPAGFSPVVDDNMGTDAVRPVSSIEEVPGAQPLRATGHTDRWLGITIAVCAALVSLGFVGHAAAPTAIPASSPAPVPASIPIRASITLVAPSPFAPSERVAPPPPQPILPFNLLGPVERKITLIGQTGGHLVLVIDGYAPSTMDSLTVRIRTRSGRLSSTARAPIGVDDERPGSDGGPRTGLGNFHQLITLPDRVPTGGWQVEIAWRDAASGASGTDSQLVLPSGGSAE